MDMDKIISDLVEKRLIDYLGRAVGEEFERYGNTALREVINEVTKEILVEKRENIKKILKDTIDKTFSDDFVKTQIRMDLAFNVPTYEIEHEIKRRKETNEL
jgi:hypothetical protein